MSAIIYFPNIIASEIEISGLPWWVWSESSLSTWRRFCYTQCYIRSHWVDCAGAQADLSLHWAHVQSCGKCCALAHFIFDWFIFEVKMWAPVSFSSVTLILISISGENVTERVVNHSRIHLGGHFKPRGCLARDLVAIIIPYRDREQHLKTLLNHLHPFLQIQGVEYVIYIVEMVWFSIMWPSSCCYYPLFPRIEWWINYLSSE